MTYLSGIRLTNFLPFRGEHTLELEPGIYAVLGCRDDDPRRSNWAGKTSLLWAIRFALYGQHPKRTEDEWITDGEPDGGVDLEFSDGVFVSRTRTRGKPTALRILVPDAAGQERELTGHEAQAELERRLALTDADSEATWWVEQGAAARLIQAEPAARTGIVAGWLGLAPLVTAAAWVASEVRRLVQVEQRTMGRLSGAKDALNDADPGTASMDARASMEELQAEADKLIAEERAFRLAEDARRAWAAAQREADAYKAAQRRVDALSTQLGQTPVPDAKAREAARSAAEAATQRVGAARAEVQSRRSLVTAGFSGRCPVAELDCPATAEINARRQELAKKAAAAQVEFEAAQRAADEALKLQNDHRIALGARERVVAELQVAEREVLRLRPLAAAAAQPEPPVPSIDIEHGRLQAIQREMAERRAWAEQQQRFQAQAAEAEKEIATVRLELAVHREALAILGRNGAQRVVAEGALTEIESRANALLAGAGIDLSLTVRWSREGKGLATHCDGCGSPYPTSQKVKACEVCATLRGPKLDEKLTLELSDTSGAARDLGGLAMQLAAGAWLRARRGSPWAVACLDEPFGQLDGHNKQALAAHLAGMLTTAFGLEQAFVVAHDPALLDGLPGRIKVVAGETGSSVEVEA